MLRAYLYFIVLLLIWFSIKTSRNFLCSEKKVISVEEDTIYGIDFEKEIVEAMLQ